MKELELRSNTTQQFISSDQDSISKDNQNVMNITKVKLSELFFAILTKTNFLKMYNNQGHEPLNLDSIEDEALKSKFESLLKLMNHLASKNTHNALIFINTINLC